MHTTLEKITFAPKHFWCLHVATDHQCESAFGTLHGSDPNEIETLHRELSRRFKSENINGIFARPANLDTVRRRFLRQPTVIEWLTQYAGISPDDAATIINAFPIRVAPRMNQNAMNPVRFLGLAAAISKNPDVIVYSTFGMDPRGISLIHKYASANYPDGCLIHVSAHPMGDVPACPNHSQCAIIHFNPQTTDA